MKKLPVIVSGMVLGLGLTVWLTGAARHVAAGEIGPQHHEDVPTDVFIAVDAVTARGSWVVITGVREGEGSAVTRHYFIGDDPDVGPRCDRLALTAFHEPGAYRFSVGYEGTGTSDVYFSSCTLSRATP
jgi:hypothetical protein